MPQMCFQRLALAALGYLPLLVSASPLLETPTTFNDYPATGTQTGYPSPVTVGQAYTTSPPGLYAPAIATTAYAPSYATGPFGPFKTHYVAVGGLDNAGGAILKYSPESVSGEIGDVVQFLFLANNHTATQADFDNPCFPKAGGFNTGFRPNTANVLGREVSSFVIENEDPAWFYCAQQAGPKPHCQAGMVFAVNVPESGDRTLESFRKGAAAVPFVPPASSPTATATTTYTATTTTAAARATYTVMVGGLDDRGPVLKYTPEFVSANVGDVIRFNFFAANHTVTQSSFDSPCMGTPDGFKTGVQMNPENISGLVLKDFTVNDSKPLWFYCGVTTHCQQGMVFAINPLDRFPEFKSKAMMTPQ